MDKKTLITEIHRVRKCIETDKQKLVDLHAQLSQIEHSSSEEPSTPWRPKFAEWVYEAVRLRDETTMTYDEIGLILNRKGGSIAAMVCLYRYQVANPPKPYVINDWFETALALFESGYSIRKVAAELGMDNRTVSNRFTTHLRKLQSKQQAKAA